MWSFQQVSDSMWFRVSVLVYVKVIDAADPVEHFPEPVADQQLACWPERGTNSVV
jgi:hypothetical protein